MKMKQFIVTMVAALFVMNATAQSLEEGIKMYSYERYASAKKALQPLTATNAKANYYYGLAQLALGDASGAANTFVKYPTDYANISGTVRVKFASEGEAAGMQAANALASMGKKKDWIQKRHAANAVNYSKGGNKQQAVDWYKEVLEKMVTPELLIETGDAYLQLPTGGGEAMNHYEKAVEKAPSNSLAYSKMGKLMYNAKNYERALDHWGKAQEADPVNPLPYYDMADAYTRVGQYEVAKKNMEKYMERSDKSKEDKIRYIEILFQAQDYEKAITKIDELRASGVDQANFCGILGYCYLEGKDSLSKAKSLENFRIYFSTQDKDKHQSQDYLAFARAYLANGFGDTANMMFDKALELDKSDTKIATYREIGESFRKIRDWKNAGTWYEKIYNDYADKTTATDYFWGGYSYYLSSNMPDVDTVAMLKKADGIYNTMIEKFPEQPSGYYWRGRVNAALDPEGKECLASPYFEQWLELDVEGAKKSNKDLQFAYQYLTACAYHKEDKENAIKYADLVLGIDPDNKFAEQVKDFVNSK